MINNLEMVISYYIKNFEKNIYHKNWITTPVVLLPQAKKFLKSCLKFYKNLAI